MTWHRKIDLDPRRQVYMQPQSLAVQLLLLPMVLMANMLEIYVPSPRTSSVWGLVHVLTDLVMVFVLMKSLRRPSVELSRLGISTQRDGSGRRDWGDIRVVRRLGPSMRPGSAYGVAIQYTDRSDVVIATGFADARESVIRSILDYCAESGAACPVVIGAVGGPSDWRRHWSIFARGLALVIIVMASVNVWHSFGGR